MIFFTYTPIVSRVPLGSKARPMQRLAKLVLPTLDSPSSSSLTVKKGSYSSRGQTVMIIYMPKIKAELQIRPEKQLALHLKS